MKKTLIQILTNLFIFLTLVFLLIFGLWGLKPTEISPAQQIGYFKLEAFPIGLSLYQQDRPFFYNISPFNDYYLDEKGFRTALVTKSDLIEKKFEDDLEKEPIEEKFSYFLRLFNINQPKITFKSGAKILYQANAENRNVLIKRQTSDFPELAQTEVIGLTITFDEHDYIFDENLNLYVDKSTEDLEILTQLYNLALIPQKEIKKETDVYWEPISTQKLYIFNPSLPGVIQINALNGQTFMFNQTYRLISVEEKSETGNDKTITMALKILSGLKEIKPND